MKFMEYIKLIRVKHYLKNVLILLALFFSGNMFNLDNLFQVMLGFICFSFVASSIYIINDIKDIENDRKHEKKKNRPLASGKISIKNAIITLFILLFITILINIIFIDNLSWIYLVVYFLLNLGYSLGLKEKPIIDILILSFGFLIRVMYGGMIINVDISSWLYLTVFSASLYMAFGKRRNELTKNGNSTRKVLQYYNFNFLDKCMNIFLSLTLVFFSLWTKDMNNQYLLWCIPLVVAIFLKYSLDVENSESYGDPVEVILADKWLIGLTLMLGIILISILYII